MAQTTLKFTEAMLAPDFTDSEKFKKLPLQAKEILAYIIKTHGSNGEVDHSALMLELNKHQEDGAVYSKPSGAPISRAYEHARQKFYVPNNWMTVEKEGVKGGGSKEPGKWKNLQVELSQLKPKYAALQRYVETLTAIMEENGVDVPAYEGPQPQTEVAQAA